MSSTRKNQIRPAVSYAILLGNVLEEMRGTNFTQAQLAQAAGVTQATWSRYENGQLSITVEELLLASQILGTTIDEIILRTKERCSNLQSRGVTVWLQPRTKQIDAGLALMGAAGLALLLGAMLKD